MEQQNDYKYIQVPLNLFYYLDANTSRVLTTLIQMSTYYSDDNGWFYCDMSKLEAAARLSKPVLRATLDTLYTEGLVDIKSVGASRGKHPNSYKVMFDRFKSYETMSLDEVIFNNPDKISTRKYKGERFKTSYSNTEKQSEKKVSTNIDNISNTYNIYNIENIDNKNIIDKYKGHTWEEYLNLFISRNPDIDYNLDNSIFILTYKESLKNFQSFIVDVTGIDRDKIPINLISKDLCSYKTKTST